MSNENYSSNTPESNEVMNVKFPPEQPMRNRELELSIKDIDSTKMLELADKRFKELSHYGFDWRSFKNGYVEAIALMLSISQPDKRVEEVIEMIDKAINPEHPRNMSLAFQDVMIKNFLTKIRNTLTKE